MKVPYHSALDRHNAVLVAKPAQRAVFNDGVALVHDAFVPLPPDFDACTALYAEPPWRAGFDKFNGRADSVPAGTWQDLISGIAAQITADTRPWVVTAGREALRLYPEPDASYETYLYGGFALLLCYRITLSNTATADDARDEIARRFLCIGDFCAGYGTTIHSARKAGARFVVSDHNPTCIGAMADLYKGTRA